MSKVNRGKQFEYQIRKALEKLEDTSVDRVHDPMGGYKGDASFCDFIVFRSPWLYYIECKSTYGNTLNFKSQISKKQWGGLKEKRKIAFVRACVIVWFIDHDITVAVDINTLESLKKQGHKSLSINTVKEYLNENLSGIYAVKGKKKRVLFEYDFWNEDRSWIV